MFTGGNQGARLVPYIHPLVGAAPRQPLRSIHSKGSDRIPKQHPQGDQNLRTQPQTSNASTGAALFPKSFIDVDRLFETWTWSVGETSKDVTTNMTKQNIFAVELSISASRGKNNEHSAVVRVENNFKFHESGWDPGGYYISTSKPTLQVKTNPSSASKFLSLEDARQYCPGLLEKAFAKCLHDISMLVFAKYRNIEAVCFNKSVIECDVNAPFTCIHANTLLTNTAYCYYRP
jgi:hypothetical protein